MHHIGGRFISLYLLSTNATIFNFCAAIWLHLIAFSFNLCYYISMDNDLGAIIKSHREEKGLSVRDLAKLANINHTDVSKLEHNKRLKPSIKMLLALSKVLQTNLLAAYLEDEENYLFYKPIIDGCTGLNEDQLKDVLTYINELKEGKRLCDLG